MCDSRFSWSSSKPLCGQLFSGFVILLMPAPSSSHVTAVPNQRLASTCKRHGVGNAGRLLVSTLKCNVSSVSRALNRKCQQEPRERPLWIWEKVQSIERNTFDGVVSLVIRLTSQVETPRHKLQLLGAVQHECFASARLRLDHLMTSSTSLLYKPLEGKRLFINCFSKDPLNGLPTRLGKWLKTFRQQCKAQTANLEARR